MQACINYKFANVKSHKHRSRHELQKSRVTSCTRWQQNPETCIQSAFYLPRESALDVIDSKKSVRKIRQYVTEQSCGTKRRVVASTQLDSNDVGIEHRLFCKMMLGSHQENTYICKLNQGHTKLTFRQWHLARPSAIAPTHFPSLALRPSFASCR